MPNPHTSKNPAAMAATKEEVDRLAEDIQGIQEQLLVLNLRMSEKVDHTRVLEMQEYIDKHGTNMSDSAAAMVDLTTTVNTIKEKVDKVKTCIGELVTLRTEVWFGLSGVVVVVVVVVVIVLERWRAPPLGLCVPHI